MYKFYYTNGYGVTSYILKSTTSSWNIAWNPDIRKWLMRINLTCLMLLIAFMQVSLAANAQKISLSKKNAPLTEIFKELRKQSGYDFVINKDQIKLAKPVTIIVKGDDLINVLNKCFEDQPFTYSMEDKMIIVVNKRPEQVGINAPPIDVRGRLVDENGTALVGASITIKGTDRRTITNEIGEFSFLNVDEKAVLVVSFIGYVTKEISVKSDLRDIVMYVSTGKLNEVSVVSTGYQTLRQANATGSFVQLNQKMLERSVSSDIISRIQDVTSGLLANKGAGINSTLSIRGKSTLFGNASPLIILDNFPFEGDLNTINPNDVESITILKDASSASIWGARAGNGVIVINSKRGQRNLMPKISFSSSIQIGDKPDAFYGSSMSSADFIEIEKSLFASGFYKNAETSATQVSLSPVVELLIAKRDGKISGTSADSQIETLKSHDVRNDIEQYIYRKSINQQYQLNLSGGSENHLYYVSAGYDKNRANQISNGDQRITLNASQTNIFFKNRLEIVSGISFLQGNTSNNNQGIVTSYPYARIVDDNGVSTIVNRGFRNSFMDALEAKGFLNWRYNPIDDIGQNLFSVISTEFRANTAIKYRIADFLSLSVNYQFAKSTSEQNNLQRENSYYVRNLINSFTSINTSGTITRPIPLGGILDNNQSSGISNNFRTQVNFDKAFSSNHIISAIAGAEVKQLRTNTKRNLTYGYSEEYVKGSPVDYFSTFPQSYDPTSFSAIPYSDNLGRLTDRYLSYFVNASYTFKNRYVISASSRLDQSNLFGVDANQKGVPLYSTGLSWNVGEEEFYNVSFLPYLKLRLTYGHSGNVFKNLSAYTTATYSNGASSPTKLPFAQIENPPNPTLRWEKVKMLNSGIDFGFAGGRVSGSIEYYSKRASDLLGTTPIASSSGITVFSGNTADTKGYGVDLILNTINVKGKLTWNTSLLFSVAEDKVTSYTMGALNSAYLSGGIFPVEGKPINSISSYAWGGLDPATGDPIGYLNGVATKDYSKIISSSTLGDLVYNGPARPPIYGSLINTFSFGAWSLSANVTYRFGYYFYRNSIQYGTASGLGGHSDYALRWQKSGDEAYTSVPSVPLVGNTARDEFYRYSNVLVESGDHIRLQDINFSYELPLKNLSQHAIKRMQVFCYASNLGIIWRKSNSNIDPDYQLTKSPKMIAFGLRMDL